MPHFRDQLIAAPLKLHRRLQVLVAAQDFPAQRIAPPLKRRRPYEHRWAKMPFPRSADRGLIEAYRRALSWFSHKLFPGSADRGPIEASTGRSTQAMPLKYFRDQLIAAPLKHNGAPVVWVDSENISAIS